MLPPGPCSTSVSANFWVVGVIALIFIGPQQLPEVARTIGRMLNELRRATDDLKGGFTSEVQNTIAKARAPVDRTASPEPPADPVTPEPEA